MSDGLVDNLNIRVSADAERATRSLNNLVNTLNKVNTSFSGMNVKSVGAFSTNVNKLVSSLKTLNGLKISTPKLSGLSKELNSLNKVDFSKLSSSGKPIREFANALGTLKGLGNVSIPKIDSRNINSVISAINKLKSVDAGKLPQVADGLSKVSTSLQTLSGLQFNDNGLNKTINALNRLFKADFSKFNPGDFKQITDSIAALGNIPDVSSSVNRFVSSLSRLANAGAKTGQSASGMGSLAEQTRLAAQKMQGVGTISDDVNMFVQSIGRLASSGNKTTQTASGLQTLANAVLKFFQTMQGAPKISQNTIAMTQALAQLATAGGKVGTAASSISSAFDKIAAAGEKTLSSIKGIANGIVSHFTKIEKAGNKLETVRLSLGGLLQTAIGFRAVQGINTFVKQMFELGSDVTEVENVVDVSFGNMNDMAYEFASTAKEQFGISELAALRFSGTMMAMFNSSGIVQEKAAEMSTTLTGLAGDLASFYNIDVEEAFNKIRSGMSGQVQPLRQLGIDMTVASIEAYAMSQGITESYRSMTQAEKQLIRYQYLLHVTTRQQGDFARTSGRQLAA